MRFSAIAALCAAPLALAGALQAEIVARGALDLRTEGSDSGKKDSKGNDNGGNNAVNVIQPDASVTEIIIIWVNNGGGAATQTVGTTMSTSGGAAAATHTVSRVLNIPENSFANDCKGHGWWRCRSRLQPRHPQRCYGRYGYLPIHVNEPHRHTIAFRYPLQEARWWYGFRIHAQPKQHHCPSTTNGHAGHYYQANL